MTGEMPTPPLDSKRNGSKPHIMVFPYPAQGHLLPLLDLTHQLICLHGDITVSIINPSLPLGVENVKDIGPSGNPLIMASIRQLREPIVSWLSSHLNTPVAIISDFFLDGPTISASLASLSLAQEHS
ncbi:hypothetical protein Bca52824_033572 [Brassica carinata]|uniref:Uncharacterized protein n=1 Tax=Brassica carinata TaxID=52824 RepID=A0A8X7V8M6_BRACI|nr:hypothetical protein Bca52824_033572 [Brassica carinata]